MEASLQQAFSGGDYTGTRTIEMSCKSTFCRLEAEHEGSEAADAFSAIRHDIPGSFVLKNFSADASGRSRTVAYFFRDERGGDNSVYRELRAGR
jgi:hypothetical protein